LATPTHTENTRRKAPPHPQATPLLPPATLAGLIVACLAALLIALMSMQSSQSRIGTVRQLTATIETIDADQALVSTLQDAETGQRGYLLTGDERYLEPYNGARARYSSEIDKLRALAAGDRDRLDRVEQIGQIAAAKFAELEETIALRRAGKLEEATSIIRSDRGKVLMDRFRAMAADFERDERARFDERRAEWESQARGQSVITWGGTALLLFLIVAAGAMASRDYRQRERNAWIRGGESLASFRIQGAQGVEKLGEEVLSFLAEYLGAKVGAVYVHDDGDVFRRVAGHALADSADAQVVRRGESLVGQAAKDRRAMRVTDVPEGYLPVASGVGRGTCPWRKGRGAISP